MRPTTWISYLRLILLFPALLPPFPRAHADRVVTTRKHLKANQHILATPDPDTTAVRLVNPTGKIRYCGYEKPLRSTKETIFIQNLTDSTICSVSFTIEYLDNSGRKIHQRKLRQDPMIPPRQTRRLDIPSWDTQKTYYYLRGDKPRKTATPYDIRITSDTIVIHPPCTP